MPNSALFQQEIPIQQKAIFPDSGNYTINVAQHMRMDDLDGIYPVGLKINPSLSAIQE